MKKMNLQKVLALLIAVLVVFSFAACGSTGGTGDAQNQSTTAAPSAGQSTSDNQTIDPLAKYDPPVTLKVGRVINQDFKFYGGETIDKNAWTDLYNEYGINIENIWTVDQTQMQTKLNTSIASGDYPDLIGGLVGISTTDYLNWAKNGVLADVTELYKNYVTEHGQAYLDADGGVSLKSAKVDGKYYGIPLIANNYDSASIMWIRNDWLKNLNLQAPKSVDELAAVAEAFTKQDPDKNGKNDTYGLALDGKDVVSNLSGIQAFFEMYNAAPASPRNNFTFVKGENGLVWGGALPGMKDGLKKLQDMYKAGSIAKDFGVMDGNKVLTEVSSGKAGMFFAPMWGSMVVQNDILKINPNADLIAVPLPGTDGTTYGKAYLEANAVTGYSCVSSKCKNPEALFKIFNLSVEKLSYTKDDDEYTKYYGVAGKTSGFKLSLFGGMPPLKNYDNFKMEKPAVEKKDPTGLNMEQKQNYESIMKYVEAPKVDGANAEFVTGWGLFKVFADPSGGYAAIDQAVKTDSFNRNLFNAPPTEAMGAKFPTLNKMATETIIKIIYGDPVDGYDTFLSNWKKLGGDEITKEANDWYAKNAE